MIDSGATALFIHKNFVKKHNMTIRELKRPLSLYNIDGTINQAGSLTHFIRLQMTIGERVDNFDFLVTDIGPEIVILGLPWLKRVNLVIDWDTGEMELPDSLEIEPLSDSPYERINVNRATRRSWIKAGIIVKVNGQSID